jgi:type IV secretory pathway VirD2 relaxase
MMQMEADLGTKIDWIAVDHHNTGYPHTHILVRGITDDGRTLNIAGDYIAHGIRERASEIVTLKLGRQTEQDVTLSLEREVDADRFTRLGAGCCSPNSAAENSVTCVPIRTCSTRHA